MNDLTQEEKERVDEEVAKILFPIMQSKKPLIDKLVEAFIEGTNYTLKELKK